MCAPSDDWTSLGLSLYSLIILTGGVTIDLPKRIIHLLVGSWLCVSSRHRHERDTHTEHFNFHKVVAERDFLRSCHGRGRVIEDLVTNEVLLWSCSSPMNDYEVDSIDVHLSSANSLGGAYREEATDQWTASNGITVKIPPLFDGPTSWFK